MMMYSPELYILMASLIDIDLDPKSQKCGETRNLYALFDLSHTGINRFEWNFAYR